MARPKRNAPQDVLDAGVAKVARLGHQQKRVHAQDQHGTRDDPVLLSADTLPARGMAKPAAAKLPPKVISISFSDSSQSDRMHQAPDDARLRQAAHRDALGAAHPAQPPAQPAVPAAGADAASDAFDVPRKVQVGTSLTYNINKRLGKGGFGQVFLGTKSAGGRPTQKPLQVAVKFEKRPDGDSYDSAAHEWRMYKDIGQLYGIPQCHAKGRQGDWSIMIMELLGPSLFDLRSSQTEPFSERMLSCIAMEAITILQQLHARGFVHGDVKPENLVLSRAVDGQPPKLYLVDLGLATSIKCRSGVRVYNSQIDNFRGTVRYASLHAHLGRASAPRDDLESLVYTLLFLHCGHLPWQGFEGSENAKRLHVSSTKAQLSVDQLCRGAPESLRQLARAVFSLSFAVEPDYAAYHGLFRAPGSGPPPLQLAPASLTPSRKRSADSLAEDTTKVKRLRQGLGSQQQFLTVFEARSSTKQRWHHEIHQESLTERVQKGWADGMYISAAVAANNQRWTFVMSSGLGYTEQRYMVSGKFLDKEEVVEGWKHGFYITTIAGMPGLRSSMVVMSKTPKITKQSYKVADTFTTIFNWVKQKWDDGMFVTAVTSCEGRWAVVMSKFISSPYTAQTCELDFSYPSDSIHERWNAGYRITACAANALQTVVFMSIPTKAAAREEETLRTPTFPAEQISEKWDSQKYISCMTYGRMLH